MRSIQQSPFAPLNQPGFPFLMVGFSMSWMLRPPGSWGPSGGIWGLTLLFAAWAFAMWFLNRHRFGHGPLARLIRVQRVLPWFLPSPVVTHPLEHEHSLRDTLLQHGVGVAEIDGTRISTWTDLARELEAAYGPMRYPSDARAKCAHILLTTLGKPPRPKVLIWRHAAHALRVHPALIVEFTSHCATHLTSAWAPFVLLLDLPSGAEPQLELPPQPTRRAKGEPAAEPALADLAKAPAGSWWKPKPGEMTQGNSCG